MKNNAASWFEIAVTDLDRAQKFYEATLGVSMVRQAVDGIDMAWFPMDGQAPGSGGGLVKSEQAVPSRQGTLVYLWSEDIDATLARAVDAGGTVVEPKTSIGEFGFSATFVDTEGNLIGLHQAPGE